MSAGKKMCATSARPHRKKSSEEKAEQDDVRACRHDVCKWPAHSKPQQTSKQAKKKKITEISAHIKKRQERGRVEKRKVPHNVHALTRTKQRPQQPSGNRRRRAVKLPQIDGEIPRKKTEVTRGKMENKPVAHTHAHTERDKTRRNA